MAAHISAARQITYAAAPAMDRDEAATLTAAMAKLLACDVAVWVTQEGQLIHGGWGYGEEYAISRYVVDALVLPIFEGVKPILELKVIAPHLVGLAESYPGSAGILPASVFSTSRHSAVHSEVSPVGRISTA